MVKADHPVRHQKVGIGYLEVIGGALWNILDVPHEIIAQHADSPALKGRQLGVVPLPVPPHQLLEPLQRGSEGERTSPRREVPYTYHAILHRENEVWLKGDERVAGYPGRALDALKED